LSIVGIIPMSLPRRFDECGNVVAGAPPSEHEEDRACDRRLEASVGGIGR